MPSACPIPLIAAWETEKRSCANHFNRKPRGGEVNEEESAGTGVLFRTFFCCRIEPASAGDPRPRSGDCRGWRPETYDRRFTTATGWQAATSPVSVLHEPAKSS